MEQNNRMAASPRQANSWNSNSHRCHFTGIRSRMSILQNVSNSWAKISSGVSTSTETRMKGLSGATRGTFAKKK